MSLLRDAFVREANASLDACREQIEHCVKQLSEPQIWDRPHKEMNSIGNLILHLGGNLRQWVVTGLSDLPDDRDRPAEFSEVGPLPTSDLLETLKSTIEQAKQTLNSLSDGELLETRRIQGFELTAVGAIFNCVPHFKGHTQEIVCLTRMQLGENYKFHWRPTTPEEGAPSA